MPGYSLSVGVVLDATNNKILFQFKDDPSDKNTFTVSNTLQPYAGRGGGVLVGVEKGSRILVAKGPGETWYCLAVIPDTTFLNSIDGAPNINTYETSYPVLKEGEVCLRNNLGSEVYLDKSGNIRIDSGAGYSSSDIELSRETRTMFARVDNTYEFTEAGRSICGVIKREKIQKEEPSDSATINFLDSESYEKQLKTIARSPKQEHHNITGKSLKQFKRNPPLIEKREILYEYANSYNVQDFESEVNASSPVKRDPNDTGQAGGISVLNKNMSERANRRTDVLNLNMLNYNHLIEKVEGTLVDIYGNILDINRNIINIPGTESLSLSGQDTTGLANLYDYHRRAIKFHYEINSRKPLSDSEPSLSERTSKNNARSFSRWSVDVDGEGLTKINIPSSSETGNIPVLSRYFTSRDDK